MATAISGLRRDITTVMLICRDWRTPRYARFAAACCLGYMFSPIQLIPDVVPVLGQLGDAVVVALGVALLLRLTPAEVVRRCRTRAAVALAVVGRWLLLAIAGSLILLRVLLR